MITPWMKNGNAADYAMKVKAEGYQVVLLLNKLESIHCPVLDVLC